MEKASRCSAKHKITITWAKLDFTLELSILFRFLSLPKHWLRVRATEESESARKPTALPSSTLIWASSLLCDWNKKEEKRARCNHAREVWEDFRRKLMSEMFIRPSSSQATARFTSNSVAWQARNVNELLRRLRQASSLDYEVSAHYL